MEAITVKVTDASTFLVLHLPEGRFTLHTASTNRPLGLAKEALLTPYLKKVGRGKKAEWVMQGYTITLLTYEQGKTDPHTFLDKNLIDASGRPA